MLRGILQFSNINEQNLRVMKKLFLVMFMLMSNYLFSQTTLYTDNDGDGVIEYTLIRNNGSIEEEGYYLNGKMVGTWTSYYTNGVINIRANFKNGLRHGSWTIYEESGKIKFEIIYKDGIREKVIEHHYN